MDVSPTNYALVFEPDLKKFTFAGTEEITVDCKRPVSTILMNCAELKIKTCVISQSNSIIKSSFKINEKQEKLDIKLSKKIKGVATINITFQGILNDRLLGFYKSQYKQGKKTKYLATTQFEAADARRAFPCWDEPQAKATFDITIIAEKQFTAISNMPVKSKKRQGTKVMYHFKKTPLVSTYLVYLGVGEFEYISGRAGKTLIRIITTKGNKSKGRFALGLAKKLLKSYEQYFAIKYPLPKLDLIAVPDFAAGAMENWGAITFRETILLYDEKTSSMRTKQFIAEVISHEIAHQWFGNLVTMKWWNDLWLNESFATFMATKFVDQFYPEWDLWSQFIEDAMNTAMELDSLKTTHPIDVNVTSPAEIREIFDAISYDKGGCILRMLEDYVGEPNFKKGLRRYLSDFKYKNAQGTDLWNAIGKASQMPVSSMVNTWLKQPGFPLVEIEQDGCNLTLRQERYLLEPTKKHSKGLWSIPVVIGMEKELGKKLFKKETAKLKIPKTLGFAANYGRKGFYRVKYDSEIMLDLKMLVDQKMIPPIDRWAVQNDLFSLCVSGYEYIRDYLDFTDAYLDEDDYLATINVAHNLTSLYFVAFNEPFAEKIKYHAANFLNNVLRSIGWESTGIHTDVLLRSFVISALGKMDDEQVTNEAQKRFNKFLKSPSSLSPDLIEPVCSIAAWNGNSKTHSKLVQLYTTADTTEEKLRFLSAMCSFQSPSLLRRSLNFIHTPQVRSQNMQLPIIKVAANPYGNIVLWPWLQKNWKRLDNKVGHGNPLFNRIIASISSVADASMESEIKSFFKKNPTPGTERTLSQTLERIRIRSRLKQSMRCEFNG